MNPQPRPGIITVVAQQGRVRGVSIARRYFTRKETAMSIAALIMIDEQFNALLGRVDEEVLHTFALTIWSVAWGDANDASDAVPQIMLDPHLQRFVARVN